VRLAHAWFGAGTGDALSVLKPRTLLDTLHVMPAKKKSRGDATAAEPQVEFLVLSIMSAVVPIIETKCGEMNKRDQNTLRRKVEKAVREFVPKR
jgi:hypothetical protein